MEDAPQPDTSRDEDEDQNDVDDDDVDQGESPAASPARDSSATPRRSGRSTSLLPRKRRFGRPRKSRPIVSDDENQEAGTETATPKRRGGFRGHRGGRWANRNRGGPSHTTQVPIDKEGNMMTVENDEVTMPEDPEGEKMVDKFGRLQGGREYRVRTFTIIGRGKRLYMLSTEPARCIGFRDSYLFFQKHKLLYKIIIDDEEKRDLIERDLIPHSYKGRAIGVVTARSVFREFGARIIIAGKNVTDDYNVRAAKEAGLVEGELAVPDDRLPLPGEEYNRNQYVAWHGASAVYHSGAPSVPMPGQKTIDGKKRKIAVTSDNWMLEHAREASRFNALLASERRAAHDGIYDIHTNVVQWPAIMQPTHARWEKVDAEEMQKGVSNGTNGYHNPDTDMEDLTHTMERVLPVLNPVYARNFRIHDTRLQGVPDSSFGDPGSSLASRSLHHIPKHILDGLPDDCRQAFEQARSREEAWRTQWSTETNDGQRAHFMPATAWFP